MKTTEKPAKLSKFKMALNPIDIMQKKSYSLERLLHDSI